MTLLKSIRIDKSGYIPLGHVEQPRKRCFFKNLGFLLLCVLAVLAGVAFAWFRLADYEQLLRGAKPMKRNLIFMVSDGFGPTSETFAREYYQYIINGGNGQLPDWKSDSYPKLLPLDTILVGQSRTRSASSWVTDSAAGATAFSCGLKSYNGAIAVNSTMAPCVTVMEAAKKMGYLTAQVVTSRITHATPGSFNSHVTWRDYEDLIAQHQLGETPLGRSVDLMFGGGRCFFLPRNHTDGSCRSDDRDLWTEAKEDFGFKTLLSSRAEFDQLSAGNAQLPMIGLFHPNHMNYEIDRDPSKEPALSEMVGKALTIMSDATKDAEQGFFMLIEGSRIDMAAHENDPGSHAREIMAYQRTIDLVKKYIDENPGTVMVSVSDHETGGMALGRQLTQAYPKYEWNPEPVARQKNSTAVLATMIMKSNQMGRGKFVEEVIFKDLMGIEDYTGEDIAFLSQETRTVYDIMWRLGDMVSRRALVAWAGHGHSGVDVNLYAYAGKGAHSALIDPIRRNLENVELGSFMKSFLEMPDQLIEAMDTILIQAWSAGTFLTYPAGKDPFPGDHLVAEHDHESVGMATFDDNFYHSQ